MHQVWILHQRGKQQRAAAHALGSKPSNNFWRVAHVPCLVARVDTLW